MVNFSLFFSSNPSSHFFHFDRNEDARDRCTLGDTCEYTSSWKGRALNDLSHKWLSLRTKYFEYVSKYLPLAQNIDEVEADGVEVANMEVGTKQITDDIAKKDEVRQKRRENLRARL